MPLLEKKCDTISDPEAREMADKSLATMKKMAETPKKPHVDIKNLVQTFGGDTLMWGEANLYVLKTEANLYVLKTSSRSSGAYGPSCGVRRKLGAKIRRKFKLLVV
jgi:hypothetical protein